MQYFIDSESKVINFFAPVMLENLLTELLKLGEKYKGYQINTVWAQTSKVSPHPVPLEEIEEDDQSSKTE